MRYLAHSFAALTAGILSMTPARADTVQFLGYSHGSVGVNFQILGSQATSGSTAAGGFLTKLNGLDPAFTTYCVDLYQFIAFNQPPYGYVNVPASAHAFRNAGAALDLARLYSSGHVVDTAVTEAAFQLAVWEIAYETTGAYKLDDGDARFSGGGTDAIWALGLATDWLGHLGSGNGYSVRVLESANNQDEVFATAIPEPGSFALALAALGVAGGATRRRREREVPAS